MKKLFIFIAIVSHQATATDLQDVLKLAIERDPALSAAKKNAQASEENIRISRANFLPQISGSWSKRKGESESQLGIIGRREVPDTDQRSWQISLNQSIYDQGNYENMKRARLQSALGSARYDIAYQDFLIRVADRYFAVLTNIDSVRLAESEERAIHRQLEQAEQRYEVGLAAITDVHEARAQYDASRANVIQAKNLLDDARESLFEVSQSYHNNLETLPNELKKVPLEFEGISRWQSMAQENNPDLGVARINADISKINVKTQRSGHYPTVSLSLSRSHSVSGNFALRDPQTQEVFAVVDSESTDDSLNLQVQVPIFSGGRTFYQTRQARLEYEAALDTLDETNLATNRGIRSALRNVEAGWSSVEARKLAVVSAKSAEEATEAGFEVGTRNIVEVLNSQRALYQAQRDFSKAKYDYLLNILKLKRAAGTLDQPDLLAMNELLQPGENDSNE